LESVDRISKVFWTFLVLFKPKVNDNSLRNQLPLVIPWKMMVKDLICEWLQLSASKFLNTGIRIPQLSCIFIFKCSSVALIFPSYYHNTYCVCMRTPFWIHLVQLASRLYNTHCCSFFPVIFTTHTVCACVHPFEFIWYNLLRDCIIHTVVYFPLMSICIWFVSQDESEKMVGSLLLMNE